MSPNLLLLVLGLTGLASNVALRIVDPIVPLLAREFGSSIETTALLASAFTLPYALGQPILGPLGDARGKARVMSAALFVLAAALAASMFAWSVGSLAVGRVLSGFAAGACIPLALAMIGDRFPIEERQIAISRYLLAVITGQIAGAPLAGLMSITVGWRPVFGISALLALLAAVVMTVTIRPRKDTPLQPFTPAALRANYAKILANPLAKYCYAAVAAEGAFIYGFLPYIAALLEQRSAGGVREAGFVVGGIGLGGLLFNLVLPPMLRRFSRLDVMRVGGVVILAGVAGVGAGPTWPLEMAAFTIVGLGFYMLHTGIQIEAMELAPEARGSAVALHAFSLFLGMALGPAIYGFAIPRMGAPLAVVVGGALVLAAALMVTAQAGRRARP